MSRCVPSMSLGSSDKDPALPLVAEFTKIESRTFLRSHVLQLQLFGATSALHLYKYRWARI